MLVTVRASETLSIAALSAPIAVVVSIAVHMLLAMLVRGRGQQDAVAMQEIAHGLAPLSLLGLAPVALLLPAQKLTVRAGRG